MATSLHKARLLTGRTWNENAAVDATFTRDIVHNNLCHLADEYAQVRVAWGATSGTFDDQQVNFQASVSSYSLNTWYPMVSFGPWPLALRQSGDGYYIRLRLSVGAGKAGDTVEVRAVVSPAAEAAGLIGVDEDYVYEVTANSTSSTTAGSSQGPNAWSNMIYIPAAVTSGWTQTTATLDDISGNARSVDQCLVALNVYGRTTSTTLDAASPILYGAYAAEWIGT